MEAEKVKAGIWVLGDWAGEGRRKKNEKKKEFWWAWAGLGSIGKERKKKEREKRRKGKVKADAIRLKDMVTIQRMAAGGLRATRRARTPITRVTTRAILRPLAWSMSGFTNRT